MAVSLMASDDFAAMGTNVEVHALAEELPLAVATVRQVFQDWEGSLSRFRPESELSALNRAGGRPFEAGELLFRVVARALAWASETGGTFDPAMLHQIERLGYLATFAEIGRAAPLAPLEERLAAGGGWRGITVDPRRRQITLPRGVGLDLGGIAKGMAVDAALDALAGEGVGKALVNAGGDLAVRGLPPGRDAWPVGVGGLPGEVILLRRGAVATSGALRRRWLQGDVERHHLLDPSTGYPAEQAIATVSVIGASCEEADVAATTAFVRGIAAGGAFLRARGLAGLFVAGDGAVVRAGAWPEGTG